MESRRGSDAQGLRQPNMNQPELLPPEGTFQTLVVRATVADAVVDRIRRAGGALLSFSLCGSGWLELNCYLAPGLTQEVLEGTKQCVR